MRTEELREELDYFFCRECRKHVPCLRIEPGVWEVLCPRCVGECGLCSCHLAGYCFGQGQSPQRHMYIVKKVAT